MLACGSFNLGLTKWSHFQSVNAQLQCYVTQVSVGFTELFFTVVGWAIITSQFMLKIPDTHASNRYCRYKYCEY